MKKTYRTESDSIGELQVERDAYYGVQTLRAKRNFSITDSKMNFTFVKNIVLIKKAAALVNGVYGILDQARAGAGRLQDRKGRIGELALLAHGQRFRHGRNALVDRHVALEHGREHGRCQRGEDVGLDAAAETVGEDDCRVIVVPFERTLVAAERLPVFVAADDADVPDRVPAAIRSFTHHHRRPHQA